MNKNSIRKEIKNIRNNMNEDEVKNKSLIIQNKVINLIKEFKDINYFVYKDFKNEVETSLIINYLLDNNKNVYLPKIINNEMFAVKYSKDTKLEKGTFGIYEPIGETTNINNFVCITPLVAIDLKGNRIGQGKGYYDKFLKDKKCKKIGICYDFQIVENITKDSYDIPLDIIISEKRNYFFLNALYKL